MLCYVMLCHAMLCDAMLCYAVLYYVQVLCDACKHATFFSYVIAVLYWFAYAWFAQCMVCSRIEKVDSISQDCSRNGAVEIGCS